jgi:hypothetical protein
LHIVTKFLVVIAAILSMLLAGLAIAYSYNADRIVTELTIQKDRAAKADAQAAAVTSQAAAERESLQQKMSALEASLQEATGKVASLQGENTRLLAEVNSLKQASVSHTAQINDFTAVVQTYAALNKAQSDELAMLRRKELEASRQEIELTDRINDLDGELTVTREANRSLQEQLVAMQEQLDRGLAAGSSTPGSASGQEVYLRAPVGFMARVTDVRDDAGATLVEIDAGVSDKLKSGMSLNITRGSDYLGRLVLTDVQQNRSVGRVDFLDPKKPSSVTKGDVVRRSDL